MPACRPAAVPARVARRGGGIEQRGGERPADRRTGRVDHPRIVSYGQLHRLDADREGRRRVSQRSQPRRRYAQLRPRFADHQSGQPVRRDAAAPRQRRRHAARQPLLRHGLPRQQRQRLAADREQDRRARPLHRQDPRAQRRRVSPAGCLRVRQLGSGRPLPVGQSRSPSGGLGREPVLAEHQPGPGPGRCDQVQRAGYRGQGLVLAGRAGVRVVVAERRPRAGGLLPVRVGKDPAQSRGRLLRQRHLRSRCRVLSPGQRGGRQPAQRPGGRLCR
ncbi:hypothetical protein D9M71_535660 [compost metagenome]